MARRVKDLSSFLKEMAILFRTIEECRAVLFRQGFRALVPEAIKPAERQLYHLAESPLLNSPDISLEVHGLTGRQLNIKLESFEFALRQFEKEGGEARLRDVLDRSAIILDSLAAAIPGLGPLAKELTQFFSKELRRRLRDSDYDAG